jgi:hypothetical protein
MFDVKARRLSRRALLESAATGAVALASGTALSARAGWIRQTIHKSNKLEAMVLSDGHFFLPTGSLLAQDSPPAERDAVLKAAPPAGDQLQLPNNIAVIRGPSDVILVDAGTGPRHQPTAGKLADNLKAAGIQPTAVTIVVLTHGHPDHLWGVLDAGDGPDRHRGEQPLRSHQGPDQDGARGRRDHQRRARDRDSRAYAGPYLRGALGGRRTRHRWGRGDARHHLLPAPLMEGAGGP